MNEGNSAHICKKDKDGYCGEVRFVCYECGHKGMDRVGRQHVMAAQVRCPSCGRKTWAHHTAGPGAVV